ncbi:hypothetical protein [Gaetbulibacter aestuarii]|uniref:Uncharacterized protein n=1 Tax=Gaetbulibacter aestuarii TaxID=1502358 RepID=A0ABW7MVA6_9FLAO
MLHAVRNDGLERHYEEERRSNLNKEIPNFRLIHAVGIDERNGITRSVATW